MTPVLPDFRQRLEALQQERERELAVEAQSFSLQRQAVTEGLHLLPLRLSPLLLLSRGDSLTRDRTCDCSRWTRGSAAGMEGVEALSG